MGLNRKVNRIATSLISLCFLFVLITSSAFAKEAPTTFPESKVTPRVISENLSDSSGEKGKPGSKDSILIASLNSTVLSTSMVVAATSGGGGTAESGISVPTIDTSQFTGAAMAKIPILVPPGRSGIQPNLNLSYNSYQKNGWIGVGWSLDVGSIQRSTKRGVDYSADDYVVVKDGSSSELLKRSQWGPDFYGVKIEGAFTKYQFKDDDGWEVTTKDGTKYFYGLTSASRQDDPEDSSRVFKWCLDRVQDTNGNYMTVAYTKDQGQIYLDHIAYTGNGSLSPANNIHFHLQERDDAPAMYTPYFAVRTAYRLSTIEIVAGGDLVRAYQLIYDADPQIDGDQYSKSSGRSLLSSVQQYGSDALVDPQSGEIGGGSALPALAMTTIQWPDSSFTLSGSQAVARYNKYSQLVPMDVSGDGRTEFIIHHDDGALQRYVSDGDQFVYTGSQRVARYNQYSQLVPLDFNGDGRMDFIIRHDDRALQRYVSDGEKFVYTGSQRVAPYYKKYSQLIPVDINGDGRMDFIIHHDDGALQRYVSDGDQFVYTGSQRVARYNKYSQLVPLDSNGDGRTDFIIRHDDRALQRYVSDGDQFVYTGSQRVAPYNKYSQLVPLDINGDGRSDFIIRHDGRTLQRYVSDGDQFVYTGSQSVAPYNGNSQLVTLDINGDGRMDFINRHDDGTLQRYISDGEAFEYTGNQVVAGYKSSNKLSAMDIDGNGNQEFVIHDNGGTLQRYFAFEDKTDLIKSMTNGLGAATQFEYTPSSRFENTGLPLIVNPVSKITIDDGVDNFTISENQYSGGFYDPAAREFRGFETVTQTRAVGTPYEIITVIKFHQDEYLKGRQKWSGLWEPGTDPQQDTPLTKTTFSWRTEPVKPPENTYAFVKLQQKLNESYDGVAVSSQEVYTYDDTNGNLLSKTTSGTDAEDVTLSYQYSNLADWMWRKTQESVEGSISGKVRETYYDYYGNGTGNLRIKEFWLNGQANPKIEMTYDTYGNQKTIMDPRGHATTTDYDAATHTFPVKISYPKTNGVSHIVENEAWDYRFGKVTITKDENGNRTYASYDQFGRPVQMDSPNGGQVTTAYYDDEFPRYVVTRVKEDASGSTIDAYRYVDGLGREIQTITFGEAGKSIVTKKFYDALGRSDLIEGPFFSTGVGYPLNPAGAYPWQQTTFDLRGRPEAIESADGEYGSVVATFSYSGLSTTATDPDDGSKTTKKDYLGRVIQVIEHAHGANYTTKYSYNVAGDLLTVKNHYSDTTTINYDTLGRKLNMNDPDMGYWEYTYDPNGNLLTQIDEKLQTVSFTYDPLNRVTSQAYSTSDPTVTYTYDDLTTPNGGGQLYTVSNTQVTTTYNAYDEMGNLTRVSKTISGDATVYTTQNVYDLSGKVTKTIYPDGYQVSNAFYTGSGLLQTVTGSDAVEYAKLSDYEPTGKMGQVEHANGILTNYTYDPETTRLTSIVTTNPGPTIDLQNKAYKYTAAGNIKEITDNAKSITYNYTYDRLHRLTAETNTGSYDPISYTYNATGNIMSKTVGSSTMTYTYDTLHKHALKTINVNGDDYNYTYDDNGNMTAGHDFTDRFQAATRNISYNADNMPTSISHIKDTQTVTTYFIYDGDGVRAKKVVQTGSSTYYVGAHYQIKDGVATRFIFAGNLRVAMVKGADVNFFHKDHLGSSTVMTDASGAAVETTGYMPFGSQRDHIGTDISDYKFTDQELDPASGLYNYNARLYDPVIGRFISADPIVQAPFDPQTLNRYSYCRNNPLIYIDPSGYGFFSKLLKKAKSFVKDKDLSEILVSSLTSTVLTTIIFSGFDIPAPGLGIALNIGIAYGSTWVGELADDQFVSEIQGSLEVIGTFDPTGIADASNALLYAYQGQWTQAGLSAIAIVPYIGDAVGKGGKLFTRYKDDVIALSQKFRVPKEGPVIIGETMARVEQAAAKIHGAKILNDMPDFKAMGMNPVQATSAMMKYNRKWILEQMRSGRQIIDIGADVSRTRPSFFYQMEKNMLKNYQKLHSEFSKAVSP